MSNAATMTLGGEAAVTPTDLGWKFIHWGLGLFIVGFVTGSIPTILAISRARCCLGMFVEAGQETCPRSEP